MSRFVKSVLTAALAPVLFLNLSAASYAAAASANATNTNSANVTPAEREKIESVVHDYLLRKPEIMLEVMQLLQRKQYEEAEKTVKQTQQSVGQYIDALFRKAGDPVIGNPKGTITVVEFFDYQCGHCIEMAPVLEEATKKNANVRIVFKEFPIRGPQSEIASRVALAANMQGKYLPVHNALLTANQPLTKELIMTLAKNAGADMAKIEADMNSKTVDDQIKANVKLAQDLKLFGTPAFFIGKTNSKDKATYVPGQMNQGQMDKAITEAN